MNYLEEIKIAQCYQSDSVMISLQLRIYIIIYKWLILISLISTLVSFMPNPIKQIITYLRKLRQESLACELDLFPTNIPLSEYWRGKGEGLKTAIEQLTKLPQYGTIMP